MSQARNQSAIFDKEYWDYSSLDALENWRVSFLRRIFDQLELRSDDVFLDIGVGGSGYTVLEASRRYDCRSLGIDVSAVGIKKASLRASAGQMPGYCDCDFIVASAEYLPIRRASISKIACIALLEHVQSDKGVLTEIARVTRKGSLVFVNVPNAYRNIFPLFRPFYHIHDKHVGHLRHYGIAELTGLFSQAGFGLFRVIYSAHMVKVLQRLISFFLPPTSYRRSVLWWKLEAIDLRSPGSVTGMQLSALFKKTVLN